MTPTEDWWSFTCRPLPGPVIRERLEEIFYSSGCSGIWEHGEKVALPETTSDPEREAGELTVYFPGPPPEAPERLAWWPAVAELVVGRPQVERIADQDWMAGWREKFAPTPLTESTLVIPSWEPWPPDENRRVIKIYPGQGFGTGTHETTRLAARLIEERLAGFSDEVRSGMSLLDVGTGSGILAILATACGIGRILALDVDNDALVNARENCIHNRVEKRVELSDRPLAAVEEQFDLVVANIIAPVLEQLMPGFPRLLKPGATLILSGMLSSQAGSLRDLCQSFGLECAPQVCLGEWAAFTCRRQE
ncbi:MAG: 50S ribosomal protein L11 methyltransferase [Deltaproteobacteria bacterium]|nr:50S ribosomal protein L11 methyltransferase [Deltaproteobacteria bacterium]